MNKCIKECLIVDHHVPWLFQNFSNDSLSLGVSFSKFVNITILSYESLDNLQILQQKLHYFGIDNLMDMFCYVTSLLVCLMIFTIILISPIYNMQRRLFGISLSVKGARAFAVLGSGSWYCQLHQHLLCDDNGCHQNDNPWWWLWWMIIIVMRRRALTVTLYEEDFEL